MLFKSFSIWKKAMAITKKNNLQKHSTDPPPPKAPAVADGFFAESL